MNFNDLNISENLKDILGGCFDAGRLMHAVILEGSSGETRLETALFLANAMVCGNDENSGKPCGRCENCLKAKSNSHCDIKTVEGANKSGTISVDDIRKIRVDAYIVPNEADKKVYIIKQADKMNETAQNALLKILEEPPSYVNFILECDDKATLLETVRSRCSSFRLGEVKHDSLSQKKSEEATENALSITRALTETEECELMKVLGRFEKNKELLELSLKEMSLIVRDALVMKNGGKCMLSGQRDEAVRLSGSLTSAQLMKAIEAADETVREMKYNASNALLLTRLCYMLKGG